ncbi:MAG: DmsC/YnfH family molybdoenzyme membrane anchor subunit [Alphaproteobacteria bacterium]
MHPAKSVILFTTASGAGYGMIIMLVLLLLTGSAALPVSAIIAGFGIAYALITVGLLSSTFHLGHPERAFRAMSQWRSSWLSREGVMAVLTYLPGLAFAWLWATGLPADHPAVLASGVIAIAFCLVTIFCTAMIYASLKTIHAWCNRWVPAGYIFLSLASGGLLVLPILAFFNVPMQDAAVFTLVCVAASGLIKLAYWNFLQDSASESTPGTATGLGDLGNVRLLEKPHTGSNYLMQEMGFSIARKHAAQLRKIAFVTAFIIPVVLIGVLWFSAVPGGLFILTLAAAISAAVGVVFERWLFFAEAKHTVMLYYGAPDA